VKDYLRNLILRYRSSGIVVDANILLLLLVGDLSSTLIERFKPTASHFLAADHGRLREALVGVGPLVVTPHIMTEVSNLLGKTTTDTTRALRSLLVQMIAAFNIQEISVRDILATEEGRDVFCTFGLTDAGVVYLADRGYLALTIDFPLSLYIQSKKLEAFNYTTANVLSIPPSKW